jgi:hypothetical protein
MAMAEGTAAEESTDAPEESTAAPEESTAAPEESADMGPGLYEVRSWAGYRLDEIGGETVGKIEGAYVDEATGRLEWLVVRLGRFGHHALVPAREAVGGVGHVWVPYYRDAIRRSPKVDTKSPLTCERERALLAHFGTGGEVGRAAELAEREAEATTARPAS